MNLVDDPVNFLQIVPRRADHAVRVVESADVGDFRCVKIVYSGA
jgi:hypothetical protein